MITCFKGLLKCNRIYSVCVRAFDNNLTPFIYNAFEKKSMDSVSSFSAEHSFLVKFKLNGIKGAENSQLIDGRKKLQ